MAFLTPTFVQWLMIGMGAGWIVTYLLIVYRSFKDQYCGMPFPALALNISWEFLYGFVFTEAKPDGLIRFYQAWFLLDVLILIAYLLYGRKEWKPHKSKSFFYGYIILLISVSFLLLYTFEKEMGEMAITYSAFLMNIVISALFIYMLKERKSISGQSTGIAFFKLAGSLCATIYLFNGFGLLLQLMGIIAFVLDVIYLLLLATAYKKEGRSLFTRKQIA